MTSQILIKFASRSRPVKFFNCLDNIISTIGIENFTILCTLDVDDPSMANHSVYNSIKRYGDKIRAIYGFSKNKIDAINRDLWATGEFDILVNMSDDFVFHVNDWGQEIVREYANFSGLLHYPDGHLNEIICTMSIMDKRYFNKFGFIYHPDYTSVYCDNEQTDVAKMMNQYKFVNKHLFEHQHPVWGYGHRDEQLNRTENPVVYAADREVYERRKNCKFYI